MLLLMLIQIPQILSEAPDATEEASKGRHDPFYLSNLKRYGERVCPRIRLCASLSQRNGQGPLVTEVILD